MTEKTRNLSVELQPTKLSQLIGQEDLVAELRNGMEKRVPLAILLAGETGVGKSTIARILSISVQCNHAPFGEPCDACLENEILINRIEQNCASLGTIGDMRELLPGLHTYPSYGNYRVIILDEAHGMGTKAQETLLLPTTNATAPNLFILCTTDPTKIIDTLKRRCKSFTVPPIADRFVAPLVESTIIRGEGSLIKPIAPLVEALIKRDIKSPGLIIMAVERYLDGATPEMAVIVKDTSNIDHWALVSACMRGDWRSCQKILGDAVPSDTAGLKVKLSGKFRKVLVDPTSNQLRLDIASEAIHELASNNASTVYEAGLQLSILSASIYKICQLIRAAASKAQPIARAA